MQNAEKRIASTAMLMVFVTLFAKVLGMLRNMLLASNFGTTMDAVAYEAASRLPLTLFDFALGGVVTAAFIPIFNELLVKQGKESAFAFANRYFNLILWIAVLISVCGILFSSPLVSFLAPKLDGEVKALAASLSRLMFPMIIFTGIAYCYVGILQSYEKYMLPAVMSLVSNLVMVLYFYTLSDSFGVWGLSLALVVGWFLQAAIQAPAAHKLGFRFKPTLKFNDTYIIRALKMAVPILVCSWLQPVCNVINTRFASGFEGGSAISMVNYANNLYIIIVGVFSFVATNLLFPKLSRSEASGDSEGARAFAGSSVKILLYIMIPLAAGIFILAEPIIRAIYMRGEFTAHDAEMTASVLRLLALGIPFMSANEVLTKLFFAMQKVKAPMLASVAAICVNVVVVTILVETIGFDGIALASSITIAVCTVINYILISRSGTLLHANDFVDMLKSVVATAVMSVCVYFLDTKLAIGVDILRIIIAGGVGVFVYGVVVLILAPSEIRTVLKRGKND
ncbi:MAG: murein biosynthesis integral membrane protein MurJ [Clostridia bacterium]|nr:murein biosynthesis integral membrane protein MurJ [Clostridia bacterium]